MSRALIVLVTVVAVATAGCGKKPGSDSDAGKARAAGLPTPAELATMPMAERNAVRTRLMEAAAAQPDTMVDEELDMARERLLVAAGGFSGADAEHTGSGTVSVYQLPDSSYIVRLENFHVTNGPGLVVALAVHPDPRADEDVQKGYISIGDLKGNAGNQNYEVPAEFDVLSFGSVVIWSDLFGVMFAVAPIKLF